MDVTIQHQPAFSLATLRLAPNETIKVEPGAMVSYTLGLTTETKAEGGLLGGLRRMVAGESFFQNTWTAPSQGGEMTCAPSLPGDLVTLDIDGDYLLASGAYIASETSVNFDAAWGGARGFFGGAGLVLLRLSGRGKVVASSYGAIFERQVAAGETYVVDTGHIVGFDPGMRFEVQKVGGWKSTILGGEGFVCHLTGPGRLLMQSRSEEAFLGWLLPKLPKSSNN
ncbi:MAG: TIGR00266 family protein [Chloroflexi bacterium]|nr:TIGR00266 family protein [Chloroflexota bacterium]